MSSKTIYTEDFLRSLPHLPSKCTIQDRPKKVDPKFFEGGSVYSYKKLQEKIDFVHGFTPDGRSWITILPELLDSEYMGGRVAIPMRCELHGWFLRTPHSIIQGVCVKCGVEQSASKTSKTKFTQEEFIEEVSKIDNGLELITDGLVYEGTAKKYPMYCKIHGTVMMIGGNILKGYGCTKCSGKGKTWDDIISHIDQNHDEHYIYCITENPRSKDKVKIWCKHHGMFEQELSSHLMGAKCPTCHYISNKPHASDESAKKRRGIFYWVEVYDKINDVMYHKIGVTSRSVKERFKPKRYGDFDIKVIETVKKSLFDCYKFESDVLKEMQVCGRPRFELKGRFEGWTECFLPEHYDPSIHFNKKAPK